MLTESEIGIPLEGKHLMMDTNIVSYRISPGLNYLLYEGVRGLLGVDLEQVAASQQGIAELHEDVLRLGIEVIPEVQEEITVGHRDLYGKCEYIERGLKQQCGSNHRNRLSKRGRRDLHSESIEEYQETFNQVIEYCTDLEGLIGTLSLSKPDPNRDLEAYKKLLPLAEDLFQTLPKKPQGKHLVKNPKQTGDDLKTDQKIVAAAFASAYHQQVLIYTNDRDIRDLGRAVSEYISFNGSNLLPPRNHIGVYSFVHENSLCIIHTPR